MRYFVKLAELLHFSDAAAALRVSQPNLSIQIQQLEEEVESILFERAGGRVRLTSGGQLFLPYAQKALQEVEEAQRQIHDLNGLLRGTLRIGAANMLARGVFSRLLSEFMRVDPATHVSVNIGTNRVVESSVRAGELDLGLIYRSPQSLEFKSLDLHGDHFVVLMSRKHGLCKSRSLRIRHLKNVALALPTTGEITRQIIDSAFAAAAMEPNVIVETNDTDVLLDLAERNVAATIVTNQTAAHAPMGNIRRIRLTEEGLRVTAAFIWAPNSVISSAAERFLELAEGSGGKAPDA